MNELKIIAVGGAGTSISKHANDLGMKASLLIVDKNQDLMNMLKINNVDFLSISDSETNFREIIEAILIDTKLAIIIGGAGGETTSKYLPLITKIANEHCEHVICFLSLPFEFEGMEIYNRSKNTCEFIKELGTKCYTASLQELLEQGFYKTQKEMFNAIGEEFFISLKNELKL